MGHGQTSRTQAPAIVRRLTPFARRLVGSRLPVGPNVLLTVRGRTSGLSRTIPVAVFEFGGRRWVTCPYGEVNWVRNLRATPEAKIRDGGRSQRIRAVELTTGEATIFFREVLGPYLERQPLLLRLFVKPLFRDMLDNPAQAARACPVFELHPQPDER